MSPPTHAPFRARQPHSQPLGCLVPGLRSLHPGKQTGGFMPHTLIVTARLERDTAAATSVLRANLEIPTGTHWRCPSGRWRSLARGKWQQSPVQPNGGRRSTKDQATEPPVYLPGQGDLSPGARGAAGTGAARPRGSNAQSHGAAGRVMVRPPGGVRAHGSGQDSLYLCPASPSCSRGQ